MHLIHQGTHNKQILGGADAGDVYCWGSSQNGQCGLGKKGIIVEPTKVVFSNVEKLSVRVIGAGAKHTVALTGE
jgi:alpha-tubulin suppressor-like RCC1 family protein